MSVPGTYELIPAGPKEWGHHQLIMHFACGHTEEKLALSEIEPRLLEARVRERCDRCEAAAQQ